MTEDFCEKIIIVNQKDEPIGVKKRGDIKSDDIFRVSALWIINFKNQILITKRSVNKKSDSGKWGPAVSGTVAQYEDYFDNITKEAKEELGIDLKKYNFKEIDKIRNPSHEHNFFCQWYLLKDELDIEAFIIQNDEVDKVMWIDRDIFKKKLNHNPERYTMNMLDHFAILEKYL